MSLSLPTTACASPGPYLCSCHFPQRADGRCTATGFRRNLDPVPEAAWALARRGRARQNTCSPSIRLGFAPGARLRHGLRPSSTAQTDVSTAQACRRPRSDRSEVRNVHYLSHRWYAPARNISLGAASDAVPFTAPSSWAPQELFLKALPSGCNRLSLLRRCGLHHPP